MIAIDQELESQSGNNSNTNYRPRIREPPQPDGSFAEEPAIRGAGLGNKCDFGGSAVRVKELGGRNFKFVADSRQTSAQGVMRVGLQGIFAKLNDSTNNVRHFTRAVCCGPNSLIEQVVAFFARRELRIFELLAREIGKS